MKEILDKLDYKIIQYLDFNARIPLTQFAKKLNLSKKSVEYRLQQLEKKGIIKGYYSVIDIFKLGYLYTRIFLTLKNITKHDKEEIIRYLQNHNKVLWLFEVQGKYDLGFVPLVKSPQELKEFILEFRSKFGHKIKSIMDTITTKLYTSEYSYLEDYKKQNMFIYEENEEKEKLDNLDTQILRLLAKDARISLVEIGVALNESPKTISYRIKQLEKKKIIQAYRIITNKSKLNLSYIKILMNLNTYTKKEYDQIRLYLLAHKNVIYLVEAIGFPFDLDFEVLVNSNQELYNLIEELRFRFPKLIGEYEIVPMIEELKTNFFPF